jgi:8-oxo-dGTP pyrophosphatase MutT (NUDIX family)
VFDVIRKRLRSPQTGRDFDFYVIDAPDWVNVFPVTPAGEVVCVRQYRAGTDAVTLEVPGGMVDPGDPDPVAAARRELEEETGYRARRFIDIGSVAPNPALQTNACTSVLAVDARPTGTAQPDGAEEIEVALVDLDRIPERIADGTITHSLVVAGFYLLDRFRQRRPGVLAGGAS